MPNNDLLLRAAVKEAVRNNIRGGATALARVFKEIDKVPAVDAVPIRRGRWIDRDGQYECSECHNIACCKGKYCPDCGALMNGGE